MLGHMFANMLAARRSLLALAALFSTVNAQNQCASVTTGSTQGTPIELEAFSTQPRQSDFDVTVPSVCPQPSAAVGARVTACDADVAPLVVAYDVGQAHVTRKGNLATKGKIRVIVYCGKWEARARSSYAPRVPPYRNYGDQNANDALRPRVSEAYDANSGSYAYDPYAYDYAYSYAYAVPEDHAPHSSYKHGPYDTHEAPNTYKEFSKVDVARPYMP